MTIRRNALLVGIMLVTSMLFPGTPGLAAESERTVTVGGQATLQFSPDMAEITLGVRTRAQEADQAAEENAKAMKRVLKAVKAKTGPNDQLSTTGFMLSARNDWDPKANRERFMGFECVNQILVQTRDIKGVGAILDAAVKSGANTINGPDWSLSDPTAARSQAQVAALENAKLQATALAQASGLSLGRVITISTIREQAFPPQPMVFRTAEATGGAGTPVVPGQIKVHAEVICVFALDSGK